MVFLIRLASAPGASLPGSWARLASGVGTLGVGGAWGAGKAANDGYQGSPGTRMVSVQALQMSSTAWPNPEARVTGIPASVSAGWVAPPRAAGPAPAPPPPRPAPPPRPPVANGPSILTPVNIARAPQALTAVRVPVLAALSQRGQSEKTRVVRAEVLSPRWAAGSPSVFCGSKI